MLSSSSEKMKDKCTPRVLFGIMMKSVIIKFPVFILCGAVFASCLKQGNPLEPGESLKNVSISRPFNEEAFQFGDTLEIEAVLNDNAVADIIQLYVNGSLVETQMSSSFQGKLFRGIAYRPGISIIKVVASSAIAGSYADSVSVLIEADDIPYYDAEVLQIYDHDPDSFTQGLIFEDGFFFESAGLYGESSLRKTTVETGQILQIRYLNATYFAEGLTVWQNSLIQLTWREQTGFVYDKSNFDSLKNFTYATEGWGLTHDGSRLIMSDGIPGRCPGLRPSAQ